MQPLRERLRESLGDRIEHWRRTLERASFQPQAGYLFGVSCQFSFGYGGCLRASRGRGPKGQHCNQETPALQKENGWQLLGSQRLDESPEEASTRQRRLNLWFQATIVPINFIAAIVPL